MSHNPIPLRYPNPADPEAQLYWPDAMQVQAETDNVGKGPKPPAGPREVTSQPTNVGKGKTPTDLFALIPRASPIAQAELFEAARAAGINQKYPREFLSSLIADKRIAVQKIRREKAKSAIGYIRSPAHPKSRGAAEDMRGGS